MSRDAPLSSEPLASARLSKSQRGHLAMLAFSALVAGSFSLGGIVANDIAPTALNAVRFGAAAGLMGIIAAAGGHLRRETFRAPWRYAVLGAFFAVYFVLMFEALKTAPPVSLAAVFTLTPLMSAGFGWILMRQVTTGRMGLALLIGGLGALWVIFRGDLSALVQFRLGIGEIVFFLGCLSHAVYTPLARILSRGEHLFAFTFGTLLAGFVLLMIYGWSDLRATDWGSLPGMVWVTIAYTSVFAGFVTFSLLNYATMRLPSAKVMAYTYLTPSWVICWEFAFGKGLPPVLVLGGIALTFVALWLLLKDE